ncbi:Polyprotein [Phytophthora palmivora]|uniref:Polyprotein n=1 Tax=Phytophthora palmivora TaxID=4796 RepID=A0A2P4XJH2_9STRA|nr:Polyprotein [Phytophthora palmivora]
MLETQFLDTPTVEEALQSPQQDKWQAALKAEYESLLKNRTWKLVERPKSLDGKRIKVLTTKWVLRIKRDENGNILRYKARLVIHGFKQRFGVEYWDTYSPVVRIVTSVVARHIDVETAFLNSSLKDVIIYMEQPAYFNDSTDRVCLLLKGIYGLKQAARIWYQTLHARLVQIGFRRCAFDVGLYVKYIDGSIVLVTVYVDDMMVIGKPGDIDAVIDELRKNFVMKDLGRVKHLLSMEMHYEPGVMLCLSQTAYIDRLLVEFGMSKASTVGSPQIHNEKMLPLEKDKTKVNDPELPYRQLVGKLQYLVSCTRPDIANTVRCLGCHAGSYTKENFSCAKRVLQYLAGTRTHGLVYRRSSADDGKLQLYGYSDADHANCPDTSRSISGHVLKLNQWSFGFKSKKQNTVTDGTCKSELVAASTCVENLLWVKELLEDIGMAVEVPKLFLDNQSALKVCTTVGNYEGVKRYSKLSHKIAELVEAEGLALEYVPTSENIADMFTKALGPQRFSMLRELLGVENVAEAKSFSGTRKT